MPIVIDPTTKRIILDSASVSATEIYSRVTDWQALSDNLKYGLIVRQVGSDDLGGGLSIPPYYFLQGSWRIRPMEVNHTLIITGNLFVEGGGVPVVPTLGDFNVSAQYTVPVQAQGISVSGSTGPSAASIASAVRQELTPELDHLTSLQNGLTSSQATMLLELYKIMGLDPTAPLVVTQSSRTAGSIIQSITGDNTSSNTITRQ